MKFLLFLIGVFVGALLMDDNNQKEKLRNGNVRHFSKPEGERPPDPPDMNPSPNDNNQN